MIEKCNGSKIRYTGRWNVGEHVATSTANGSYFEFAFCGECAVMEFDISAMVKPFPHIYVDVDNGANIEVTLDKFVRVSAESGTHKVCVIMKSSVETQNRWYAPIEARVSLVQIQADEFLDLPEDNRPIIEFIGDSITEGISIDVDYSNYGGNEDMVYWDDSTAGYAWRTAKLLDYRVVVMGYGCLGTTKEGAGNVPPVGESYSFYSDGCPIEKSYADVIVINHGTNDRRAETSLFKEKYSEFLDIVRKRNPKAKIISLTPFSGCLAKEIRETVAEHNISKNDDVFLVDTTGWIEPEPIHPMRAGHKTVSEKLAPIIRELMKNSLE